MKLLPARRLNERGIAHHFILPVIAILVVAGIGAYILKVSHAGTQTSYYNSNCINTTYGAPNSTFNQCTQDAQILLNGIQHSDGHNDLKLGVYNGSTFQYGSLVYLLMNGLYGKYTAQAVTHATGDANGQLTKGQSGTWQHLCTIAASKGLNSDGTTLNFAAKATGVSGGSTQYLKAAASNSAAFKYDCGSLVSPGGSTGSASSEGAAFLARAEKWQGLGYANTSGYGGNGGLLHAGGGYAPFIKACEGGVSGGKPAVTSGLNSQCATDCSGFVSMVVDDVLHTNYIWLAGTSSLSGTGSSNWKPVSINSARPGDIAVGNGHVEFVESGTGQGMKTYGEHRSGETVGTGGGFGITQVYRWQ
jgi:hypothetical protein